MTQGSNPERHPARRSVSAGFAFESKTIVRLTLLRNVRWFRRDDVIHDIGNPVNPPYDFAKIDVLIIRLQEAFQADFVALTTMDVKAHEFQAGMILKAMQNLSLDPMGTQCHA